MRKNICLKSTLRQPVRTLLLAAVSFGFFSQLLQCWAMTEVVDQLSAYYQTTGTIQTADQYNSNIYEGAMLLEDSPYIQFTDQQRIVCLLFNDIYNADTDGHYLKYYGATYQQRLFLTGRLQTSGFDSNGYFASFQDLKPYKGLPEMVPQEKVTVYLRDMEREEAQALVESLSQGETYFFTCCAESNSENKRETAYTYYSLPLDGEELRFYPLGGAEEPDLTDPALAAVPGDLDVLEWNLHAAYLWTTKDMTSIHALGKKLQLVEGRMLTYEDYENKSPVCVIREELASLRDISVGDTISISVPERGANGYAIAPTERKNLLYEFEPWDLSNQDLLPLELTVVGVCRSNLKTSNIGMFGDYFSTVYVPTSLIPEDRVNEQPYLDDIFYSFVLNSPDDRESFLAEYRDALRKMGMTLEVPDNGWENFKETAVAMKESTLFGAALFGGILVVAMALTVLLYLLFRRRDMARQRALGVSRAAVTRQSFVPIGLLGAAALGLGTAASYHHGMEAVEEVLNKLGAVAQSTLEETGTARVVELTVSPLGMAAVALLCWLLLALLAFGALRRAAGKPVLLQLQGGKRGG